MLRKSKVEITQLTATTQKIQKRLEASRKINGPPPQTEAKEIQTEGSEPLDFSKMMTLRARTPNRAAIRKAQGKKSDGDSSMDDDDLALNNQFTSAIDMPQKDW